MALLYGVYLVGEGHSAKARSFKAAFKRQTVALQLPRHRISVRREVPRALRKDVVAVCLYLASRSAASKPRLLRSLRRALDLGIPVVPVVDEGESFSRVVPSLLHPFNAFRWDGPTAALRVSMQVLRSLGLAERQRRVFISYRRDECLHIGEQLWETLSKHGFQVFLDRFGVEPGADFQQRLYEALDDKSFLLLVESPHARDSKWVDQEVQYARKRNIGLAVLTWPETVAAGTLMPGVYEKYRMHIPGPHLARLPNGQGRLSNALLKRVVDLVEERHADAFLRRRRELMGSLQSALTSAKVRYKGVADWSVLAVSRRRRRSRTYVISVTPRPPDVPDLFALDSQRNMPHPGRAIGVLVHTHRTMSDERTELIKWVVRPYRLRLVPEDQIVRLALSL